MAEDKTPGRASNDTAGRPGKPNNLGGWVGVGIGAGIGSAAIAAALLYANRTRPPARPKGAPETD